MTDLRCISLHQPWASLIAIGVKTIETRSWPTKVRGRIGIASTAKRPSSGSAGSYYWEPVGRHWELADREDQTAFLPLGALVATAKLVDCVPMIAMNDMSRDGCHRLFVGGDCLWRTRPGGGPAIDITDQRPYGGYTPGRWAWLLADIKSTSERCPACWGRGADPAYGFAGDRVRDPSLREWRSFWGPLPRCSVCKGDRVCDPVPVKGRQGLWTWSP